VNEIDLSPLIAALAGLFPPPPDGPARRRLYRVPPPGTRMCRNCRAEKHFAKTLCRPCYGRWRGGGRKLTAAGYPKVPPPRPRRVGKPEFEDYMWLRRCGEPVACAAVRAGIAARTAGEYEREMHRQEAA
jgi:hypothetical protein